MKRRLRTVSWFPDMDKAIESFVASCSKCQQITEKTTKVKQKSHRSPDEPWESVSGDHFGSLGDGAYVLAVRCDLSRFPSAAFVPSNPAFHTIAALEDIYTNYGYPSYQRSDNGPAFQSTEFRSFCEKIAIKHQFTAPYHPRANPAETFMKVLKNLSGLGENKGGNACRP